jgi:hypothetical protein
MPNEYRKNMRTALRETPQGDRSKPRSGAAEDDDGLTALACLATMRR